MLGRNRIRPAALAVAAALLLCPALASPASASNVIYAGGVFGPGVAGLSLGPGAALDPLPGSPWFAPPEAESSTDSVALSPDGEHLYATSAGFDKLMIFDVEPGGALDPRAPVEFAGPPFSDPEGIAITPDGRFAYVADGGPEAIRPLELGPDGSVEQGDPVPLPGADFLQGVAITPDGRFLYVASGNTGHVYGFAIAGDGSLTPLSPAATNVEGSPVGLTVTPDGRYLYAGNDGLEGIEGFAIGADGSLTAVPGSPFAPAASHGAVAASPVGSRLYATADDGDAVLGFEIAEDGSLSEALGSPYPTGNDADAVAVTPDGLAVIVGGGTQPLNLSSFSVGTTGFLTPAAGSPFASGVELPQYGGLASAPDQPPRAELTVSADVDALTARLDASASTDPDGEVERYRWDFGDGQTAAGTSPTITHRYATQGNYNATVTLVDDQGCSTEQVFTGQTVACNGGRGAIATRVVDLDPVPPGGRDGRLRLRLGGPVRQKLGRAVKVRARCSLDCRLVATGKVTRKRAGAWRTVRGFGLKRLVTTLAAERPRVLKVKVPPAVRRRAGAMLRDGATLRAAVRFRPSSEEERAKPRTRFVKLYR